MSSTQLAIETLKLINHEYIAKEIIHNKIDKLKADIKETNDNIAIRELTVAILTLEDVLRESEENK
jgi:GTP-binding protein EngB required for normal cell division